MFILALLATLMTPQAAPGAALEQFFTGVTEGTGTVDVVMAKPYGLRDRTRGRIGAPGELLLDQTVKEEGKPMRKRYWRLVRSGGNKISGSISDARGPVTGEISGSSLRLRYRLTEGPSVDQLITLHPSGRSATNSMTFRRFGFKVATVESVLRKIE